MSSDRVGKYRERKCRTQTPYSRPKGLIRRVTDSVSGLLGSSWIPGFLRAEEDDSQEAESSSSGGSGHDAVDHNHQQTGSSSAASVGAEFSFAPPQQQQMRQQHTRSLAPIYPEEASGDEWSSSLSLNNTSAASSPAVVAGSSNKRHTHSVTAAAAKHEASTPHTLQEETRQLDLQEAAKRLAQDSSFREPQQQQQAAQYSGSHMPHTPHKQYPTTPTQYTFHHQHHQSSTHHSVERTSHLHQQQQKQGEPFSSSVATPQNTSYYASGMSGGVTGSGEPSTPSARLSSAQSTVSSSSSSKRPRFSLAAYTAAASPVGDKSVLSEGSFRSSPFYPGRTMYGGAAAYRRTPTPLPITPTRSATASPRMGGDGDGLSSAAQRILACLNAMSTPLSEAKRIPPTPTTSPFTSYLDSPYTAAFHKHRPQQHRPPPPHQPLRTPTKATIQNNMAQYVLPTTTAATTTGSTAADQQRSTSSGGGGVTRSSSSADHHGFLDHAAPSIFSVAAASATRSSPSSSSQHTRGKHTTAQSTKTSPTSATAGLNPLLQSSKHLIVTAGSAAKTNTSSNTFTKFPLTELPSSSSSIFGGDLKDVAVASSNKTSDPLSVFGGESSTNTNSGKMKSAKINALARVSSRGASEWEMPEAPPSFPQASLPKMAFSAPLKISITTDSDGFKFSVPEVLGKQTTGTNMEKSTTTNFMFSVPSPVDSEGVVSKTVSSGGNNFVVPTKSTFVPKLKSISSPGKEPISVEATTDLNKKPGGLLEFLNKKSDSGSSCKNSSNSNNNSSECSRTASKDDSISKVGSSPSVSIGWGDKFKVASGSWECSSCLVRNKADANKCVSCESVKPGQSSSSTQKEATVSTLNSIVTTKTSTSGFGDMFKKSSGDWDCDECLLRNKGAADECVACKTANPAHKSSNTNKLSSSSTNFSFGVKQTTTSAVSSPTFKFGVNSSNNIVSPTTSSSSGFKFGTPVSSSASASAASIPSSTTTTIPVIAFSPKPEVIAKTSSATSGFGDMFKKASGEWECGSCLVRNKSSASKCVACQSAKPGAIAEPAAAASVTLPPSLPNNLQDKANEGFGNKFKKAAGDWECEVCLVNNKSASVKCISCETPKPGAVDKSKVLTGNFTFGVNNNTSSNSSFKFGVVADKSNNVGVFASSNTPVDSVFKFGTTTSPNATNNASFGATKPSLSTEGAPFVFGVSNSTVKSNSTINTGVNFISNESKESSVRHSSTDNFTFKSPTSNQSPVLKTKTVEKPLQPSADLKKGSVTDFLKKSFENTSDTANKNTETVPTFNFGGNVQNKSTEHDALPTPRNFGITSNYASKPTFAFGTNASLNATKQNSTNLFSNSTNCLTTLNNKDETKAGTKRSLTEDDDHSKHQTNSFSGNNGIAKNSQFTFGKSMNTTAAALFQLQPNSSIASSKVVPSFGSTTFGAAPSLANNNNNTTVKPAAAAEAPEFAFGQPPEKKQSASFNFGQASPHLPTFNFATTTPPTFQFAQGNNSGSPNNSVFQFGNSNAAAANATPTFGGASASNPFSQSPAGTPSGRIVKRAIRRNKK